MIQADPAAGHYVDAIRSLAAAGVAASEGHDVAALAGYRDALDEFRACGARFNAALAQLAALATLPHERALDGWATEVHERFAVGRSPALLARLEEVVSERTRAPAMASAPGSAAETADTTTT